MSELNQPAQLVLTTLRETPELNTPPKMASRANPLYIEQVGEKEYAEGLYELRALGLAHEVYGVWKLGPLPADNSPG